MDFSPIFKTIIAMIRKFQRLKVSIFYFHNTAIINYYYLRLEKKITWLLIVDYMNVLIKITSLNSVFS